MTTLLPDDYCPHCYAKDGAHLSACDSPDLEPAWILWLGLVLCILVPAACFVLIGVAFLHVWGF